MIAQHLEPFIRSLDTISSGIVVIHQDETGFEISYRSPKLSQILSENDEQTLISYLSKTENTLQKLKTQDQNDTPIYIGIHNDLFKHLPTLANFYISLHQLSDTEQAIVFQQNIEPVTSQPIKKPDNYIAAILESSQDIHLIINYKTETIEFINNSVNEILQFPESDFIGEHPRSFYKLLHDDDRDTYLNFWREIPELEKQDVFLFSSEFRMKDNSGRYHWFSQYQSLTHEDSQPSQLICNIREITDIKSIELTLRDREHQLSNAIAASKDGVWEYNINEDKVYYSIECQKMLGYTENMYGERLDDLKKIMHPNDIAYYDAFLSRISAGEEDLFNLEFRLKNAMNGWSWIELRAKVSEYLNNKVFKLVGTHSVISERKEAEVALKEKNKQLEQTKKRLQQTNEQLELANEELKNQHNKLTETYTQLEQSEEFFRQFAESIDDVFWLRSDTKFLYINSSFEKIWGRSRQLVFDNPFILKQWIHPEDLNNFEAWVEKEHLSKDNAFTEQYRIVRPDNSIRWLWSRIFPVFDENGEIYRIVGIASDITEQKKFEHTLKEAKEKAQESDQLKSAFLANISHEIRTPMNGMIGFADLLAKTDPDEETKESYSKIIKKSSDQLVRIIDDIIDFAKIESNQMTIKNTKFQLNKLIKEQELIFRNYLENNQIDNIDIYVNTELDDDNDLIYSDELRIKQVLNNLIDNAIKYTEEGPVTFGYRLKKDCIEFFVHDCGIGIQEGIEDKIFGRFRQGDEGQTRKYGGTGLGLPISKGLVNLMGGKIWYESTVGSGSVFYFTIPVVVKATELKDEKIIEPKKFNWKDKVFLVVEDDALNFEYLNAILEPTEATIIHAEDGSQAVKMCSSINFDMILMDVRLPVMNGIQATKFIRKSGVDTPIIAQTAFALSKDKEQCFEAGCNEYITKPIQKELLFSLIDKFIKT